MASDQSDEEYYEVDDLEEIHNSIVNNDIEQLREACEADADVNEKFTDDIDPQHAGMTALALASALNRVDHVKMLLDHRANINETFASLHTTALMTSSFHGHEKVVRLLLGRGANPRAVDMQGSTALGYAFGGSRSIEVVKMLLAAGVDVNQKNMLGMNALLLVAGYGNDVLVKLVLQSGADPNAVNDFGHSALHLAVVGKRSQVAALTVNRGASSLYGLNRRGIDGLLKDWCSSHRDLLGLRQPDNSQLELVGKFMMDIGSKLDEPDGINQDDQEAMKRRVEAVWRYRDERLQAAKENKKSSGIADTFLSCGGKRSKQAKKAPANTLAGAPSSRPESSFRPTSQVVDRDVAALSERCALIVRDILDAGCVVDKTESTFGMTALDMAILMGDVESTAQLLAAGADPEHLLKLFALTDLYDVTVLHPDKKKTRDLLAEDDKIDLNQPYATFNITKRSDPVAAGQVEAGGDDGLVPVAAAVKGNSGDSAEIIKMLIKKGAQVNKVGPGGRSALGEACRADNVKMVQMLLSQGADIEQPNPFFKDATPVTIGVICKNPQVVSTLIEKGAKVDKPMTDGRVAVIKAMENGDMPMIDILLAADKDQNFANKGGFTYEMADLYQRDDRDIEKILRSITEKTALQKQQDDERERIKKEDLVKPAPPVQQQQQQQQPWSIRAAAPPPQFDSEESDEEDAPPLPPAPVKGRAKQPQQPPPQPKQQQQQPAKPQPQPQPRPKSQQKPQSRPPPPPQQLSSEDESEEEEESEEEPVPPKQVGRQQQQPKPQVKPQQQPQPPKPQAKAQQPQPKPVPQQQRTQQQPKPQARQPPPPREPSSEEEESEEEEEEEEEEVQPLPPPVKQQPKPPQQPPKLPQVKPPPPQTQPKPQVQQKPQQKPQSRPPPPPKEPSSEEEESEDEEEEEEEEELPPPPVKKAVVPVASQNRKDVRNEPKVAPVSKAPPPVSKAPPPQKIVKQASLPSSPPPPLPSSGPPGESSEDEETDEDESFEAPPPPPPVSKQPVKAPNNHHATTVNNTRAVKSAGPPSNSKAMVTKVIKSSNGTRTTHSQPVRAPSPEDESSEEEESEEEDVNRNAYIKPSATQRPTAARRPVISAETDI